MASSFSRNDLQAHLARFGYERVLGEEIPGGNRADHGHIDTYVATDQTVVLAHSDTSGTVDHVRAVRRLDGAARYGPALAVEDAEGTARIPLSLDSATGTIERVRGALVPKRTNAVPGRIADVSLAMPHDHARLRRARVLDDNVSRFDRRAITKYDDAGITLERARRLPTWAQDAISFADPADRNAAVDIQSSSRALENAGVDLPNGSKPQRSRTSALIQNYGMADPRIAEYIASELRDMADQLPNKDGASYGGLVRAIDATDAHAAGSVADEVAENSPRATEAQRLEGMIRQWTDERMHGARTADTPHASQERHLNLLAHHEKRLTQYSQDLIERRSGTTEAIAMSGPDGRELTDKAKGALYYFRNMRTEAFARRNKAYQESQTEPTQGPCIVHRTQMRLAAADLHGSARVLDARRRDTPGHSASGPDRSAGPNPLSAVHAWTKPVAALPGSAGANAMRDRVSTAAAARKVRDEGAIEM